MLDFVGIKTGNGELVGLVVGVNEIFDDGAGLPEGEVGVWVLDY